MSPETKRELTAEKELLLRQGDDLIAEMNSVDVKCPTPLCGVHSRAISWLIQFVSVKERIRNGGSTIEIPLPGLAKPVKFSGDAANTLARWIMVASVLYLVAKQHGWL